MMVKSSLREPRALCRDCERPLALRRTHRPGRGDGIEKLERERETCFACAVRCKRAVQVQDDPHGVGATLRFAQGGLLRGRPYVDPLYGGPEYESLAALGSSNGIDDLIALAKANELGAAYGFDTISMGVTLAFAMECFEREVIAPSETDGIELRFGNARALLQMIEKVTRRAGFGNVLAEGVARAAKIIGRGAEEFAMQVHGQERR